MPLSRHSLGTYQETSSHATRQRTLGHSRLSSLSHRGLILALRVEFQKAQAGNDMSNILPKSSHVGSTTTTTILKDFFLSGLGNQSYVGY